MGARGLRVAVLALLALLVALPASAQTDPVQLQLEVREAIPELGPGETGEAVLAVTNTGQLDGTATLAVPQPSPGWQATLSASEVEVPAGETREVTLTLTAPTDAPESTSTTAQVQATLEDATGQFSDSAEQPVTAQLVVPPPPPPPEETPWALIGAGAAVGVALLGAGGYLLYLRRRETGVSIDAAPSTSAAPGRESFVPVEVRNESNRPRIAQLEVQDAAPEWRVGLNLTMVPLQPGQARKLWLSVRPPDDAGKGRSSVAVAARPAEAHEWRSRSQVAVAVEPATIGKMDRAA